MNPEQQAWREAAAADLSDERQQFMRHHAALLSLETAAKPDDADDKGGFLS